LVVAAPCLIDASFEALKSTEVVSPVTVIVPVAFTLPQPPVNGIL